MPKTKTKKQPKETLELRDARAAMRELIGRVPRDFDYADAPAGTFDPKRGG